MDKFSKVFLVFISLLLCALLVLGVIERIQNAKVVETVTKSILKLERERIQVFKDYVKDLESPETKSVYHQMYHASNAQLKMLNILVQENRLLMNLISGKRWTVSSN